MSHRNDDGSGRRRSAAQAAAAIVLFAAVHAAAALALPERVWGAHHLRYLPPGWIAAWAALLAVLLVPPLRRRVFAAAAAALDLFDRPGRWGPPLLFLAAALFLYLFRTGNLFLGDGWLLTSVVRNPEETGMGSAGYLSLALHRALFGAIRAVRPEATGGAPFRLVSILAGASAVLVARAFAAEAAAGRRARRLLFATLLLSGGSLLFFGYVEYYPPMQAALLLYLWLGVRHLRGKGNLALPTAALLLAAAFHISSLIYGPTWILLLLRGRTFSRRALLSLLSGAALAAAAGGWAIFHYTEKVYRGTVMFLPLLEKEGYSYGFLSAAHAADAANFLLLLLGGALLFPLLLRRASPSTHGKREEDGGEDEGREEREGRDRAALRFLLAAALLGTAFFLIIDPKLGARDWDLMAIPLFPLLLLLARPILFGRAEPSRRTAALLAGAMLLHTGPWIAAQLDQDRAVRMTLAMIARDRHYDNPKARAPKAFGVLLARRGYDREATLLFERAAETVRDPQNYYNLGTNLAKQGDFAGAAEPLEEAIRIFPGYRDAYVNLATVRVRLNEPARAESTLLRLIAIAPEDYRGPYLLGTLRVDRGRYREGLVSLGEAVRLAPENAEVWSRYGSVLAAVGAGEEARRALRRALMLDPGNERAAEALEKLGEEKGGAPGAPPGEERR